MKALTLNSLFLIIAAFAHPKVAEAKTVRYELNVRNEKINLSGQKEVDFALTVNGGIPAPTLEFTEGDEAEILVKNDLQKDEVSIHWHGILLPPEEDGVAYTNTPPIFPSKSRLFKFKIRQSGTFWYHSHTGTQEQKGVYGALVIHPKKKTISYDKDLVVVLSDWSDEDADQILRNLRKDGDYYLYKKNSVRSITGAIQNGKLKDYFANEWTRMGGMDLSDVGYDAFLINGKREQQFANAKPGERIRIRVINAAASSYFYLSLGQDPMTVISADGVDIAPTFAKEVLIGMAETYDILFTVPKNKSVELKATSQDVTGSASTWIGTGEKVFAPKKPMPDFYASMQMDHSAHGQNHSGHAAPQETNAHAGHEMNHSGHSMPSEHAEHDMSAHMTPVPLTINWTNQSSAMLTQNQSSSDSLISMASSASPIETLDVDKLRALQPTTLPKDAKIHELKLVLDGSMERYIWHINGKAIYQDQLLEIDQGEIVRITFENKTMMHHPMHLHGHFFRVLNEAGDLSPLKHTVDVSPHMTRTIEFYANEPGQWMLHCHNLYHMHTGMARVVKYRNFNLPPEMTSHASHDPHLHNHTYTKTRLEAATNHLQADFSFLRTWDQIDLKFESRNTDEKAFSFKEKWEPEGDLVYRRWFSNYLNLLGGGTHFNEKNYAIAGVGYILPLLIESQLMVNNHGKFRLDLEKRLQWTSSVFSDLDFSWKPDWAEHEESEFEATLMYGPSWNWAAGFMATEKSIGVGAEIKF